MLPIIRAAFAGFVLSFGSATAAEPDLVKLKKEYLERESAFTTSTKQKRDAELAAIYREYEAVASQLKKTSRASQYQLWKQLNSDLAFRSKQYFDKAELNRQPMPRMAKILEDMKEGDLARITVDGTADSADYPVMQIVQIKDAQTAIVRYGRTYIWMEMPTKGLVDRQDIHIPEPIYHKGTIKKPILGSLRTVYHLVVLK